MEGFSSLALPLLGGKLIAPLDAAWGWASWTGQGCCWPGLYSSLPGSVMGEEAVALGDFMSPSPAALVVQWRM